MADWLKNTLGAFGIGAAVATGAVAEQPVKSEFTTGETFPDFQDAPEPAQRNTSASGILTVDRISDGENFRHNGPVIVENGIGEGANVVITNGGLTVESGGVGDGTSVILKQDSIAASGSSIVISNGGTGNIIISKDGGVSIIGNNNVGNIVNTGQGSSVTISTGGHDSFSGITINGKTGDNVTYNSSTDIELNGDAGNYLDLSAARDVDFEKVGSYANLSAGRDLEGKELGEYTRSTSVRDTEIEHQIGEGSHISVGRDLETGSIAADVDGNVGRDLEASSAFRNATILSNVGRDVDVDRYVQPDTESVPQLQ